MHVLSAHIHEGPWQALLPSTDRHPLTQCSSPKDHTYSCSLPPPRSRSSLSAQCIRAVCSLVCSPLFLASLVFFLPLIFTLPHSVKLFNKYLQGTVLARMLWTKIYRKLTQKCLSNRENFFFLEQDIQTAGTGF
jgi:hypothetical protein